MQSTGRGLNVCRILRYFNENRYVSHRSKIDLEFVSFSSTTKHRGMGLFTGPKRLTSLTLKLRFSSSDCNSSGEISVGIPVSTTFRERSSGSLLDLNCILRSNSVFCINRKCLTSRALIIIDPLEVACAVIISGEISGFLKMVSVTVRQEDEFIKIRGMRINDLESVLVGVVGLFGFESEFA